MPGYSPLPRIELDPRNEAELVKAAARRVYEASNSTLNDFSAGSPIMALLEGQAFAQSEFLQFANQFPESVLTEWIGPFLGAQRRRFRNRYERRGPIEAVQTVLHDQGRREWSRSCHSKENRRSTRRRDAGQKRARRRNSIRRHPTVELADT